MVRVARGHRRCRKRRAQAGGGGAFGSYEGSAASSGGRANGPEVGPGVIGADTKGEGELVARLLRRDDRIDEATRRGVLRVELLIVIGAHRFDGGLSVGRRRRGPPVGPARSRGHARRVTAASPSMTPMRPVGQEKMKVGIEALTRHGVVPGAGRVVHREHELGHHRRRHRLDEVRAGPDDARSAPPPDPP